MSVPINIQGTIIQYPSSSGSPNWAPELIKFSQAVEAALAGVAGPFDVAPQTLDISASNPGVAVVINPLNFPTSSVRSAFVTYAVYRSADSPTTTAAETGTIIALYDTAAGSWLLQQDFIGDGQITFAISNTGQISYSTTQIGTTNHSGILTFSAKAVLQNS